MYEMTDYIYNQGHFNLHLRRRRGGGHVHSTYKLIIYRSMLAGRHRRVVKTTAGWGEPLWAGEVNAS